MELLVATAVAGVVLSASYGWVWNVASLAGGQDDRAQAGTIAAAAARTVAEDVCDAVRVTFPPAPRDPGRSLALVHDHVGVALEEVLIVWDPTRRVLWRNASGTYIADHITDFQIGLALDDGRLAEPSSLRADRWARVVAVRISVTAQVGEANARRTTCVRLGST